MADFCQQCSIEMFGEDTHDLSNLNPGEELPEGMGYAVICEGCGPTLVDKEGKCISEDCMEKHGKKPSKETLL